MFKKLRIEYFFRLMIKSVYNYFLFMLDYDFCWVANFIDTLLEDNNHYVTDIKRNRNAIYYILKSRNKSSVPYI